MINLYTNSTIGSYTTGTVSCTKNSATVTGTGTTWSEIVNPGDILTLNDDKLYVIKTVNSNTSITLDKVFAENTVSNSAYRIFLNTAAHFPSDTAAKVERALEQLSDINEAAINNDRTVTAATKVNGKGIESTTGYINLNPPSVNSNDGGSLRFHYNQSSSATSKIYEDAPGQIKIDANVNFSKHLISPLYKMTSAVSRGVNTDGTVNHYIIRNIDANTKDISVIYNEYKYNSASDYNNAIGLYVYDPTENTSTNSKARIQVGYNQNGAYTYAPTPATTDNSTKIATTAFVKAQGCNVDSSSIGTDGYIRFTNGLQLQWGQVNQSNSSSDAGTSVTFTKAFSSEPRIFVDTSWGGNYKMTLGLQVFNRSATGFSVISPSYNGTDLVYDTGGISWFAIGPWS